MMNEDVSGKITMKYDSTADTLSLHFGEPHAAHDSEITKEGVVVRLREGKIVADPRGPEGASIDLRCGETVERRRRH